MTTKSICEVFGMVQDGAITTREQAAAYVAEEAGRIAQAYNLTLEEASRRLLDNIGYCTGYCSHEHADRIMDLFQTEHPMFGKTHPTPEEALRMGIEMGEASRKAKEL